MCAFGAASFRLSPVSPFPNPSPLDRVSLVHMLFVAYFWGLVGEFNGGNTGADDGGQRVYAFAAYRPRAESRKASAVANASTKIEPMDNHIKQITRKVSAPEAHKSMLQNARASCIIESPFIWPERIWDALEELSVEQPTGVSSVTMTR